MNKVIILGLGKTGLSCVHYFLRNGVTPTVVDTRNNPPGQEALPEQVPLVCGPLDATLLCQAEMIIASPGMALATPALQAALQAGVEVIGDIELFVRAAKAPIVAITGSNGKSTVTTLVGDMAAEAGLSVGVGGNIGTPALDLLLQPAELYVLELSSFQLETTFSLKAAAAVILNLSEDHLDRYEGMAGYLAAKQRIHQGAEHIISNRDDAATVPVSQGVWRSFGLDEQQYGRVMHHDRLWLAVDGEPLLAVSEMKIVGAHNQMNALAAMALCDAVGIARNAQLAVLRRFQGLPHRCQFVREHNGVRWINDSKATNVGSTEAALNGLQLDGTLYLLLGGDGKSADFTPLKRYLGGDRIRLYCFGRDGAELAELRPEVAVQTETMEQAMRQIAPLVKAGDMVLLSPACASLDQFKNFEQRGEMFARLAKELG